MGCNRGRKETGHPPQTLSSFFCFVAIVFLGCAVLTPLLSLLSVNRGFCPACPKRTILYIVEFSYINGFITYIS